MNKSKKGLADNQEGQFILNESGTSVSIDPPQKNNTESTTNNHNTGEHGSIDPHSKDNTETSDNYNAGHNQSEK